MSSRICSGSILQYYMTGKSASTSSTPSLNFFITWSTNWEILRTAFYTKLSLPIEVISKWVKNPLPFKYIPIAVLTNNNLKQRPFTKTERREHQSGPILIWNTTRGPVSKLNYTWQFPTHCLQHLDSYLFLKERPSRSPPSKLPECRCLSCLLFCPGGCSRPRSYQSVAVCRDHPLPRWCFLASKLPKRRYLSWTSRL